jgi:hypothetical protein
MIADAKRQKFLETQRLVFKEKTNFVVRRVKEERFRIEDEKKEFSDAYARGDSVDFGVMMCLTTRTKIHRISLDALKKMRNYDSSVDITRLERLVKLHATQLQKIGTVHADVNAKYFNEMYDAIRYNMAWLDVIKKM